MPNDSGGLFVQREELVKIAKHLFVQQGKDGRAQRRTGHVFDPPAFTLLGPAMGDREEPEQFQ